MKYPRILPCLWLPAVMALAGRLDGAPSSALGGGTTNRDPNRAVPVPDGAAVEPRKLWHRDFSSPAAYDASVQSNREHLRQMVGAIDARSTPVGFASSATNASAETAAFRCEHTRWPVFPGVWGEGLRLRPARPPLAAVVALPDADQTPEMLVGLAAGLAPERQFARRLAEQGCEVIVPVLVDRTEVSNPGAAPAGSRRDRICREAYPLGRHLLGYEIQKVLAAVDAFTTAATNPSPGSLKIGVAGYGEGGLLALYSAALDSRLTAALVSGYFDTRTNLGAEPLSRVLFGFQREFGDAELATLIAPRALVVEYSPPPTLTNTAAAKAEPPDFASVEAEFDRARALLRPGEVAGVERFTLISGTEGMATGPGSDRALTALLKELGVMREQPQPVGAPLEALSDPASVALRQQRQAEELEQFTRQLREQVERNR